MMFAPPPPTPTLVPVISRTVSATQTLQLQEFTRQLAYGVHPSTVMTKTVTSGSVWVIERRFTYGEMGLSIICLALVLVLIFDLVLRIGTVEL